MGSFGWDNRSYLQYHNGRPLSVALTEPCNCQLSPFIESDFGIQRHARSNSSGRRHTRESYSIYQPNVQYTTFFCSPPIPHRPMNRSTSGDLFIEKFETVTIEEEQCQPIRSAISYARTPSPPVRQVKIRSRPSSCYDLHDREATDQRWTKYVDEHHEEHYNYNYNYTLPVERTVPIRRDPTPPRLIQQQEIKTTTEDFNFHITAKPALRPSMRSIGTSTIDLRPLSRSETQVIERYEKDEKIRRDSLTETSDTHYSTTERPLQRLYDSNNLHDIQNQHAKRKAKQKDFMHRMYARNGTMSRSQNALNLYSEIGRNDVIIRPTHKPREALVDTYEIVAPPTNIFERRIPISLENSSRFRRDY